jgi:hypothetical protein
MLVAEIDKCGAKKSLICAFITKGEWQYEPIATKLVTNPLRQNGYFCENLIYISNRTYYCECLS